MLAVCAVAGNVAHSGSGAVPKSTLERCWWRGSSWWHQCRCKHQGPEQRWPVTPKHHRHKQMRSGPSVDVEMRRTRGPRSWRDSAAVDLPSFTPTLKSRRCRLRPAEQDRQRRTADSVHRSGVSSAYACGVRWWRLTSCNRSAVYRRNKIGPRTEPRGTPKSTADGIELDVAVRTRRARPPRHYYFRLLSIFPMIIQGLVVSIYLRFNGHFPDEPGLAGIYWSKGWWKWWWQHERHKGINIPGECDIVGG